MKLNASKTETVIVSWGLAALQDFWSPLSVSVERSCWPCIWWCMTDGFKVGSMLLIGLSCSVPFCILPFVPFSSFFLLVGIVGLVSSDLLDGNRSLPALRCWLYLFTYNYSNLFTYNYRRNRNIGRLVTVTSRNLWPRPISVFTRDLIELPAKFDQNQIW